MKKKIIHAVTVVDKSGSMTSYRNRTIEGINDNIRALKAEVDDNTEILNTQLQFSSEGSTWATYANNPDTDFKFVRVGQKVQELVDMTEKDYEPKGGTPLIDAIGYAVEKVKDFHGDKLGDENLKIIVTIYTDGEENSSMKWKKSDIKKIIDHFQSDGKWTFTFVGCGSFENVSSESATYGISASNTLAVADSMEGRTYASAKISTSYSNYARSVKLGTVDNDLFAEKLNISTDKTNK